MIQGRGRKTGCARSRDPVTCFTLPSRPLFNLISPIHSVRPSSDLPNLLFSMSALPQGGLYLGELGIALLT